MKPFLTRILGLVVGAALLSGCASSPSPRHFTLSAERSGPLPQGLTPSIVITQISLPDLIDRPQLVVRRADNRITIDETRRWAEPLRRDIPRVLADELGQRLDSGRVLSLPIDGQSLEADFRLILDIQRLEAVEGQGAQADVVWRLLPRHGPATLGRSVCRTASVADDAEALVAAQRSVVKAVAADIALKVVQLMEKKP